MAREDVEDAEEIIEIDPDHLPAFEIFSALGTQWRIGMNGTTGLDYPAVLAVMDLHGVKPEDKRQRFDELRIMEQAALDVMREKSE